MGKGFLFRVKKYSKIDCGDDCTTLNIQKIHQIVPFKGVNCMLCESYFNKAVVEKNLRRHWWLSLYQLGCSRTDLSK